MKNRICLSLLLAIVLIGCQSTAIAPLVTPTPPSPSSTPKPTVMPASSATAVAAGSGEQSLSSLAINWAEPFVGDALGESIVLTSWSAQPYAGENISLPLDLSQVANLQTLDGLTAAQKDFLAKNGFVVIHSQEAQFGDIRVETSQRTGQPYYLTTDAAFHALHLLFDDMLKSLERESFRTQMIAITNATLQQARSD
ncbi:MAG TPA: DUF3160 domain-containing protein, partial [Anaerolineales bacterium]|nr:DUF3160 domain-containing protein [Anaerolineales bacterium]